jgi:hypothetical protein
MATLTRRAEDIVWAGPYAECLLLAQSGHSDNLQPMSAFGGKADIGLTPRNVCF